MHYLGLLPTSGEQIRAGGMGDEPRGACRRRLLQARSSKVAGGVAMMQGRPCVDGAGRYPAREATAGQTGSPLLLALRYRLTQGMPC